MVVVVVPDECPPLLDTATMIPATRAAAASPRSAASDAAEAPAFPAGGPGSSCAAGGGAAGVAAGALELAPPEAAPPDVPAPPLSLCATRMVPLSASATTVWAIAAAVPTITIVMAMPAASQRLISFNPRAYDRVLPYTMRRPFSMCVIGICPNWLMATCLTFVWHWNPSRNRSSAAFATTRGLSSRWTARQTFCLWSA